MGTPRPPSHAALVVSVLYGDDAARNSALHRLADEFGPGELHPVVLPFDFTDYYAPEMGTPLSRVFWMAERPVERDRLADVKIATNRIEAALAAPDGRRTVNLDPGLLSAESVVLATTKPYSHRIYLRDGIFAELTLIFANGGFQPLSWTYPDYAGAPVRNALKTLRQTYIKRLKAAS